MNLLITSPQLKKLKKHLKEMFYNDDQKQLIQKRDFDFQTSINGQKISFNLGDRELPTTIKISINRIQGDNSFRLLCELNRDDICVIDYTKNIFEFWKSNQNYVLDEQNFQNLLSILQNICEYLQESYQNIYNPIVKKLFMTDELKTAKV
jgi:hypothetical protein